MIVKAVAVQIHSSLGHFFLYLFSLIAALAYASDAYGRELDLNYLIFILPLFIIVIANHINNKLISWLLYFWLWWSVIGVLNSGAWAYLHSVENVDFEYAVFLHLLCLTFFAAGSCVSLFGDSAKSHKIENFDLFYLFVIFAVLLLIESYLTAGYFPLFSGESFVDDMYGIEYGKLYSFKVLVIIPLIWSLHYLIVSKKISLKFIYFFSFIAIAVCSVFDGKRVVLLAFAISFMAFSYRAYNNNFFKKVISVSAPIVLVLYVLIANVRGGHDANIFIDFPHLLFYQVGVEFRDFAWTLDNYEPTQIPGYSWTLSSIGSLVNSSVLSIFDIDKADLVGMDSARAWMNLYDIQFGVRTGFFSEIYFEFGYLAIFVAFSFGVFLKYICVNLMAATDSLLLTILSILYGYVFLAVMGQSSVFFGVLITLFYLWVPYYFYKKFVIRR